MPRKGRMSRPMSRILFPLRGGDHPSGPPIAGRLKQLPSDWAGSLHPTTSALRRGLLPCSRWGLPGHLRHRRCRCALTAPFHPDLVAEAVYFLLHFPADRSGLLLATTVPCGVRTFLDPRLFHGWSGSRCRGRPAGSFARYSIRFPPVGTELSGIVRGCLPKDAYPSRALPSISRGHSRSKRLGVSILPR